MYFKNYETFSGVLQIIFCQFDIAKYLSLDLYLFLHKATSIRGAAQWVCSIQGHMLTLMFV